MKLLLIVILFLVNIFSSFAQIDAIGETALYEELKKVDLNLNITYKKV
jgi:hypothetical protein